MTTIIRRDGRDVARVNDHQVLAWFHHNHGYSMAHALEHEGYSIETLGEPWWITSTETGRTLDGPYDTEDDANGAATVMRARNGNYPVTVHSAPRWALDPNLPPPGGPHITKESRWES